MIVREPFSTGAKMGNALPLLYCSRKVELPLRTLINIIDFCLWQMITIGGTH
jgi:hypothetical protein